MATASDDASRPSVEPSAMQTPPGPADAAVDVPDADLPARGLLIAAVVLAIAPVAAFLLLRLAAPAHWMSWDEAYYLGIGTNILQGRGIQTVFGEFAGIHSPLWALILEAPSTWLGIEPERWGHPLVAVAAAALIGTTGWFAWRSVRIAAPLAIAVMAAFPFLVDLAGRMGLDVPVAALTMLYVGLGIAAVRRGSLMLGLVSGATFAAAFLIKESALPFAPVPILAGLVRPATLASIGRATAGIVLAGMVGTSWWFVVYAAETGTVYRLGTPAWTLVLLLLGLVAVAGLALALGRLAPATRAPVPASHVASVVRSGWVAAISWALILTLYFALAPNPVGTPLLSLTQLSATIRREAPGIVPLLAVALPGLVVAIADRVGLVLRPTAHASAPGSRSHIAPDDRHAIDDLILAGICGLPMVLLVTSVGEGPRHYLAQLGFLVALGAIGWAKLLAAIVGRRSRMVGPVLAAGLLGVVAAWSVVVLVSAMPTAPTVGDVVRAAARDEIVDRVRAQVPAGSAIVFGGDLAMETALGLQGEYRTVQVTDETGIHLDASAPLGLASTDGSGPSDWLALWVGSRDATGFVGRRAAAVTDTVRSLGPGPVTWIETSAVGDQGPIPFVVAMQGAAGVREEQRWSRPYGTARLETFMYSVDPSAFAFAPRTVVTTSALSRIVRQMEARPGDFREAARALVDRIVASPAGSQATSAMDALSSIAGP